MHKIKIPAIMAKQEFYALFQGNLLFHRNNNPVF